MLWFEKLMGFKESTPEQVRKNIVLEGKLMKSLINNKSYQYGSLEIPTLSELRKRNIFQFDGALALLEVIEDVQLFHLMSENEGAFFQAASQFNLLEMVNPRVTPEDGVAKYEFDKTQGPACAIACGAGTIFRNYFVQIGEQIGQTANNQIDCLEEIGNYFDNDNLGLWNMENGYAFVNENGLNHISKKIKNLSKEEYEALKGQLKVGIQWDTEVTISPLGLIVSQIYCSGLPVNYSNVESELWEEFACLILDATYEATFHAAMINYQNTGNNKVYLTLVGGGVFGNKSEWIIESILINLKKFSNQDLDIRFVSYGSSNPIVRNIIERYNEWKHPS